MRILIAALLCAGAVWGQGISGGGGATVTPGGSSGQMQYNNGGAFGGITNATSDGTTATLTSPVLVTPKTAQINDTNGNGALAITATASAVDYLTLVNSATGSHTVAVNATGTDTNISIRVTPKGSGGSIIDGPVVLNGGGTAPTQVIEFWNGSGSRLGYFSSAGLLLQTAGYYASTANDYGLASNSFSCNGLCLGSSDFLGFSSTGNWYDTKDVSIRRIGAKAIAFGGGGASGIDATIQSGVTATDPGCTTTANIGKLWFDITTTTTAFKVCMNVAGTVGWVTK